MKKLMYALLLAVLLAGCTPPAPPPSDVPQPVQVVDSSLYNHVIALTSSLPDGAISDAQYDDIDKAVIMDSMAIDFDVRPMVIKQPDGGVALRYKVIDADGMWRKKHAYFVFDAAKTFVRKSKS